jgi:proliferating cell nuclear antigen
LTKILKCAKDTDELTLKANDDADTLGLVFQNGSESVQDGQVDVGVSLTRAFASTLESDRLGEYEMKLMDIDQEHLGIPDTSYDATVTLASSEFARICRDLSALGESVRIDANKDGVRFTCEGEIGNGSVLLKPTGSGVRSGGKVKKEKEGGRKKTNNKVVTSDDEDDEEDDVKPKVEDGDAEGKS